MNCPYHKLKEGLPALTKRIARLIVAPNGYPTPAFVTYINGEPDFRLADPRHLARCVNGNVCWVCGENMGAFKSFVVGPMGYVNRIASDAFMHLDCAEWSVKGCPFLARPSMTRREDDRTDAGKRFVGGVMIEENPGVMCIYTTKSCKIVRHGQGILFTFGPAESTSWWHKAAPAAADVIERAFAVGAVHATAHCDEVETKRFTALVRSELQLVLKDYSSATK